MPGLSELNAAVPETQEWISDLVKRLGVAGPRSGLCSPDDGQKATRAVDLDRALRLRADLLCERDLTATGH